MAFKFNAERPSVKVMNRFELLQAQEELNQAFMDLTDVQKNMNEVCEVMENIHTSVDLIAKYGAAGIEQLNIDGSLEALCGIDAKLITVEKAQEGLGAAAKKAYNVFVEAMRHLVAKLVEWMNKTLNYLNGLRIKWFAASGTLIPDAKPECVVPPRGSCDEMAKFINASLDMLEKMSTQWYAKESQLTDQDRDEFIAALEEECKKLGISKDGGIPSHISSKFLEGKSWKECGYASIKDLTLEADKFIGTAAERDFKMNVTRLSRSFDIAVKSYTRNVQVGEQDNDAAFTAHSRIRLQVAQKLFSIVGYINFCQIHYCAIWSNVFKCASATSNK